MLEGVMLEGVMLEADRALPAADQRLVVAIVATPGA